MVASCFAYFPLFIALPGLDQGFFLVLLATVASLRGQAQVRSSSPAAGKVLSHLESRRAPNYDFSSFQS